MNAVTDQCKINYLDAAVKTEEANFGSITSSLTNSALCVGCGSTIEDPFILHVQPNLEWHNRCLNCFHCNRPLGNDSTCFVRDGKAYCREDYAKTFLSHCSGCHQCIEKADLVFRLRGQTFHADCFHCVVCERILHPGEEIAMRQNQVCCLLHAHLLMEPISSKSYSLSPSYPGDEELTLKGAVRQACGEVLQPSNGCTDHPHCQGDVLARPAVGQNLVPKMCEFNELNHTETRCQEETATSRLFCHQTISNNSMDILLPQSDSPLTVDSETTCDDNDAECNDHEDTDFEDKVCIPIPHSDDPCLGQDKFDMRTETPLLTSEENASGVQNSSPYRSQSSKKSLMLISNGLMVTTESGFRDACTAGRNDCNSKGNLDPETVDNLSAGSSKASARSSSNHQHGAVTKALKNGGSRRAKDQKATRVRTVLNEKQLHTLRNCYAANPRPDALMKEQLVEMTNLSPRVIRVWFQNKRCKDKKRQILLKQMEQQQQQQGTGRSGIIHGLSLIAGSPIRNDISLLTTNCAAAASIVELHQRTPPPPSVSYWNQRSSVSTERGRVPRIHQTVVSSCDFEAGLIPLPVAPLVPAPVLLLPPPPPPTLVQGQPQRMKSPSGRVRLSPSHLSHSTASCSLVSTASSSSSPPDLFVCPPPSSPTTDSSGRLSPSVQPPSGLLASWPLAPAPPAYLLGLPTPDPTAGRQLVSLSTVSTQSSGSLGECPPLDLLQQSSTIHSKSSSMLQSDFPIFPSDLASEQYTGQFSGHGAFQRLMSNYDSNNTRLAGIRQSGSFIRGSTPSSLTKHLDYPSRPPPTSESVIFPSSQTLSTMPRGQTPSSHVADYMHPVSQVSKSLANQPSNMVFACRPLMLDYNTAGLDGTPMRVDMHQEPSVTIIPQGHFSMTDGMSVDSDRRPANLYTRSTLDLMPVSTQHGHTHDHLLLSERLRKAPSLLEPQNRPSLST